jgi:cell division protein FtsL
MAPWMIVAVVAVIGFLGLGFARTSLDGSAFELSELESSIEHQQALNEQLKLEVARLENPARIAPLAEKMGMVVPIDTDQILVDLTPEGPRVASADTDEETQ